MERRANIRSSKDIKSNRFAREILLESPSFILLFRLSSVLFVVQSVSGLANNRKGDENVSLRKDRRNLKIDQHIYLDLSNYELIVVCCAVSRRYRHSTSNKKSCHPKTNSLSRPCRKTIVERNMEHLQKNKNS